ncbi:hypothetical protein BHYA_0112g00070 [Botrytis hyacinthi]|uniref:Uncharacterized protein n=1 Tax=Botrytis hyacinthi TaxID=278943 RepID=A0A4Z1GKT9_9HELO|nr:hypothetical protein BHYA_0112g00070 [Botrytis hyacinthi]
MLTQKSNLFRGPEVTLCTVTQRLAAGLTRLCLVTVDWSSNSSMLITVGLFQTLEFSQKDRFNVDTKSRSP